MAGQLSMDQAFLERLKEILESNFANEHFGVQELADEAGVSRSQLHRKLNALIGKSSSQYIREYRLEKALEMLQNEEATASEIAYRVGFNSPTYFNTCFSDFYGYTPGEVKFQKTDVIESETKSSEDISSSVAIQKKGNYKSLFWVGGILILLFLGYSFYQNLEADNDLEDVPLHLREDKTIAVLPFQNLSDDSENQYFADGIREDIINHLSKVQEFIVKSRQSTEMYRDSHLSAKEIGFALSANYILGGSVQKHGNRIRVRVHLINSKTDVQLWFRDFDREFQDIFELESEISRLIASELNVVLSPHELELIDKVPTDNLEAYNLYIKALYSLYYDENVDLARRYFNLCIEEDTGFALAYSGLAESYLWENWPTPTVKDAEQVKELAIKAMELDESLSEPHRVMAYVNETYDWNWTKAETEFQEAVKLNPNNYYAISEYAMYLQYVLGDFEKAREMIELAQLVNPNSAFTAVLSAEFYLHEDNFKKALEETRKAKEYAPKGMWAYWVDFKIYTELGNYDQAVRQLEESWGFVEAFELNIPPMLEAYEKDGVKGVYRMINDMDINNANSEGVQHNAYWIAQKFAFLEEPENALKWLEIAFRRKNAELFMIKYDPYFENLRSNADFLEILQKMNLGDYQGGLKL
ncbi:helix-turn-helix domain-containing protein [Mangrovimonas sp. YM274]|uniref:helix-turn-helix domain-containing protein n=1 Tax=Mangrovimonas sp. YM274 TaxID=3070660 RepID=UPI0027DD1B40|nr:helix-turn-helix domain-containing protein [Mangrovimonas sp. YM274]WMI70108.1 helix-turn-helix domain-containing protein [Mangrovimonas sp. YM274]